MRIPRLLAALLLLLAAEAHADALDSVPRLAISVRERVAHDPTLFTQGMAFAGELLIESGGGYRSSRLLVRDPRDPAPRTSLALPRSWFAEGVAVHADRLTLLTWQEGIAQQYSLPDLRPLQRFRYRGEGWGLASDGHQLIQSDGSPVLRWRDPVDFRVTRSVQVHIAGQPLGRINELEWVEGWVVANVWQSAAVVGIDPADGAVRWQFDIGSLLEPAEQRAADVPNGLAWHAGSRTLWVSGKLWPWLFALDVPIPPIAAPPAAQ